AAQEATAAHGNCLTRLFPLVYVRVAVPASCGAPWTALAFCDRGPCSASLHPPQAALGSAALRQNFAANRALVANAPRTQFAAKFPCRCRRRRRMSADGDVFNFFDRPKRPPADTAAGGRRRINTWPGWRKGTF